MIASGFAGAVAEELKVGDLLLAENFSDRELFAQAEREFCASAKPASRNFLLRHRLSIR